MSNSNALVKLERRKLDARSDSGMAVSRKRSSADNFCRRGPWWCGSVSCVPYFRLEALWGYYICISIVVASSSPLVAVADSNRPEVSLHRLPHGEIQPQARIGADGKLHLLTFRGDPSRGDLYYRQQATPLGSWAAPVWVNHRAGSAVALGTIRGGQLAVGYDGRVHVVWNGARPAASGSHDSDLPLYYTRSDPEGRTFEPERNVIQFGYGLDGGSDVAVDVNGNVYVVWHGRGEEEGEAHRRVYVAVSHDNGVHFQREEPINPTGSGACACCGLKCYVHPTVNHLLVLFRAAPDGFQRDMFLLCRVNRADVRAATVGHWQIGQCPMSSAAFAAWDRWVWVSWETAGQIYLGKCDPATGSVLSTVQVPGAGGQRRHPALAVNQDGYLLCAWSEGTGWNRPGRFAWQLFDSSGKPVGNLGEGDTVPVWSFVAAFAQPQGGFVIVF